VGFACVRCGQDLPTEARFCLRCGASIDGAPPPGRPEEVFRAPEGLSVGRDAERAALAESWDDVVRSRTSRAVCLVGAPGVGKSRLVRDLLQERHVPSWTLRCASAGEALGIAPLAQLLLELSETGAGSGHDTLEARLTALLPEEDALVARLLSHAEAGPGVGGVEELPGDLGLLLREIARRTPGVLLVDDLDAATPRLRDVLVGALATCRDAPLLVAVTTAQPLDGDAHLPFDKVLQVEPLGPLHVAELLVGALGGSPVVEELAVPVARAAEGSPLLLEQLLALLVDDGTLTQGPGGWQLQRPLADLPRDLDEVTAARVSHLSVSERRAVECAAVLGDEMGVGELLALTPGGQDPTAALNGLVARHLLQPVADGHTYRFPHAALRAAVYRTTHERRLSELHLRAADHIEHVAPGLRERIAVHLERAVTLHTHVEPAVMVEPLARRAAHAWHDLGRRALLLSELSGARSCLERGLMIAPSGSAERPALLQALGEVQLGLGEASAAVRLSQEAAALAEGAGDEAVRLLAGLCRLRAETALGTIPPRPALGPVRASATRLEARREWARAPRAWRAVAEAAVDACDWEAAAAAATRACRRARETASPDLGLCLVRWSTIAALGPMPVSDAREVCRDALREAPPETLASARCTANAALVACLDGREQEAGELLDYSLDVARWRNTHGVLAEVLVAGGRIAMAQGREHAAIPLFSEARSCAERAGLTPRAPEAYEAYARARVGDHQGARLTLERTPAPGGDRSAMALAAVEQLAVVSLVESVLHSAGDPVAAVSAAHAAAQLADQTGLPLLRGEARRVLWEALTRVEATDDARDALDAAREIHLAKGANVLVGQLALELAAH